MFGDRRERLETEVDIGGERIALTIARQPRARRIILRIERGRRAARVSVPPGRRLEEGLRFALSRRDWLKARLAAIPAPRPFAAGQRVPYRGEMHLIRHDPAMRGPVRRLKGAGAALPALVVGGDAPHLPRRLGDWLKARARAELTAAAAAHAAAMGLRYRRITLRDQKSRWGSCSARGNLNFSWRLILAPPFVLDYLAAHEVAHLAHADHSARFWALVRAHCPRLDEAEDWLREHGESLHAWGTEA